MIIITKEFLPSPSTRPIGLYLTIGYWGLGLEFGIGIREWNFDSELGIETRIGNWDLGFRSRTSNQECKSQMRIGYYYEWDYGLDFGIAIWYQDWIRDWEMKFGNWNL